MTAWYGLDPAWTVPFEAQARREHGVDLCVQADAHVLTYRHRGVEVPGRREPVPVVVRFYAKPLYDTYGLGAQEFPRVCADPGAESPHRHGDDSLCLYYAEPDPSDRWTPDEGLAALLNLTRDHLFFELHWRATCTRRGGVWLAPEAPHVVPRRRGAA